MANSWDPWSENLIAAGGIDAAGIYGKDGNAWSQRGDNLTPADVKTLGSIITDGNNSPCFGTGVTFASKIKWTVVRVEEDCVILKGKGDEYKEYSLVAISTPQSYVVAYSKTASGSGARDVNNKVRGLAESLKAAGY